MTRRHHGRMLMMHLISAAVIVILLCTLPRAYERRHFCKQGGGD